MAQQRKLTRKEKIEQAKQHAPVMQEQKKKASVGNHLKRSLGLIVAAFAFLLYIGTVNYSYTLDDFSTIKENYVVQKGLSGIGTILKTSYRYGYWSSTDELYRPLSLVLFAVEWNYFPNNPGVAHGINVLLYALTGFLLFNLLCRILKNNYLVSFITTILFIAHPVHTEIVASIKSGDELLSFLFGIISIDLLLDYIESRKVIKMLSASAMFFLALMAKESALTLLAVIPLLLFVFKDVRFGKALAAVIPLFITTLIYMLIRASVLHGIMHTKTIDVLDNVLMSEPNFFSRLGTIIYVLGKYLLLLVFPVHLSIDYSVREIPIINFIDYRVLISLAVYAALIIYAAYNIKRKDIIAFGILFYLITISIVSNLLIIIGTVMADRLLYLPSLGFCLVIAVLLGKLFKAGEINIKMTGIKDFIKIYAKPLAAALVLFLLYSFKTIDRLPVWKDNNTLYSSGVVDAPNSSRTHYLMGIELKNIIGQNEPDSLKRIAIYKHAIDEFKQAVALYPSSFDAYRDMGRAYDEIGDIANALKSYDMALKINPNDSKTLNNKSTLLFAKRDYAGALELLKQTVILDPRYADGLRNLGSCYGMMGDYSDALIYLFKSLDFENDKQKNAGTYRMIGMTYLYMGDKQKSDEYIALSKQNATGGN